jgi:NSS family neurotransmitter:Na+ symporter
MNQQKFSSRLTTILTMAGIAIGLGNVWRFPYMMGQHGGSAFLIIYLVFVLLLAVPAISAEWSLGRATGRGPIEAYRAAFGKKSGFLVGMVLLFSIFMALCYYNIVVANIVYSVGFATWHGFDASTLELYQAGLARNGVQYSLAIAVTGVSLWIVHRGLKNGIEWANKLFIPIFGLIGIYFIIMVLNLDGAMMKLRQFLVPDFTLAGPDVWFAAMGQACFSMGISGAMGVMYGAYLRRDEKIVSTAVTTGLIDTGAAFMATLFVVPAVLVFGLNMAVGPGLLFDTLPRLFAVMPGGRWLASLFLIGWTLVALLSIIATFDAIISGLASLTEDRFSRRQWTWTIGIAVAGVMLPIAWNPESIGTLDMIFGSGMFITGSLLAVIGLGWGLGKLTIHEQLGNGLSPRMAIWFSWWLRYVVPIALFAILAGYILSVTSNG